MTPEEIARLITEEEKQIDPGDMGVVRQKARILARLVSEFQKFAELGNIRAARATLAEISGEITDASVQVNRLAREHGLSDLKPISQI